MSTPRITDSSPTPGIAAPESSAPPAVAMSADEGDRKARVGEAPACSCRSDVTSLNPAEIVVHCADGPCYIAPAVKIGDDA